VGEGNGDEEGEDFAVVGVDEEEGEGDGLEIDGGALGAGAIGSCFAVDGIFFLAVEGFDDGLGGSALAGIASKFGGLLTPFSVLLVSTEVVSFLGVAGETGVTGVTGEISVLPSFLMPFPCFSVVSGLLDVSTEAALSFLACGLASLVVGPFSCSVFTT